MIRNILNELSNISFELNQDGNITTESWQKANDILIPELNHIGSSLISIIQSFLNDKFLNTSVQHTLYSKKPSADIAECRIIPNTDYYSSNSLSIPYPENSNGNHATGLKLSMILRSGYPNYILEVPNQFIIEFEIWGAHERACFKQFFYDYKRLIKKLLINRNYEFFNAVPFDNLSSYKGKDIFKQLELYFDNQVDSENNFTISKTYFDNSNISDVLQSIIPLAILYDCALGYAQKRKNKDRILNYLHFIK